MGIRIIKAWRQDLIEFIYNIRTEQASEITVTPAPIPLHYTDLEACIECM